MRYSTLPLPDREEVLRFLAYPPPWDQLRSRVAPAHLEFIDEWRLARQARERAWLAAGKWGL